MQCITDIIQSCFCQIKKKFKYWKKNVYAVRFFCFSSSFVTNFGSFSSSTTLLSSTSSVSSKRLWPEKRKDSLKKKIEKIIRIIWFVWKINLKSCDLFASSFHPPHLENLDLLPQHCSLLLYYLELKTIVRLPY